MLNRVCIKCGKSYGQSGTEKNGGTTGGLCLDCFIGYLDNKIAKLEERSKRLKRELLKKVLQKKLEERRLS